MRKVIITGVSGMLGKEVKDVFKSDYEIYGIDVKEIDDYSIEFIKLDITKKDEIYDLIPKINPDYFIHLAAYTDVDRAEIEMEKCFLVNAIGTRNVSIACQRFDTPLLYISTDYVFDGKKGSPYLEYDNPNPINSYGMSKYWGEIFVRDLLQKFWIVRSSWLFGEGGKNFVDTILKLSKRQPLLRIVDDQIGSPTYTKDLAFAIRKIIEEAGFGIYHITNSGYCSWYEFANEVLKMKKKKLEVVPIKSDELHREAKRPEDSRLENFMWKLSGFKPLRDWKEALKEYLEGK
ncbi:MAG: dTDP-4-dehydrorhamnose reductase [Caldiserica bacterium]|nr:MAG: dTDP-4-dehydrorhamnose reductase [Caldisericota bacterium]